MSHKYLNQIEPKVFQILRSSILLFATFLHSKIISKRGSVLKVSGAGVATITDSSSTSD